VKLGRANLARGLPPVTRAGAVPAESLLLSAAQLAPGLPALDRARPINAYVIEHREGPVLFDAEQDRASVPDPGLRDSTAMINTMRQRDPGLVILPAYDPAAASRLAQATDRVPALATV